VRETDFVHLYLDPVDVLRAHEHGIENCVVPLGTLSSEFFQTLSLWMEQNGIAAIEPMSENQLRCGSVESMSQLSLTWSPPLTPGGLFLLD
jgi:hypothetical protein